MRRLLTLLVVPVVLLVLPLQVAPAANADPGPSTPRPVIDPVAQARSEVASLDAQISEVQRQVREAQSSLLRWSYRLDAAERATVEGRWAAHAPSPIGSSRYANLEAARGAAQRAARDAVRSARQRVTTIASDPTAVGSLLRVFVLQDQLRSLQVARTRESTILSVLLSRPNPAAPVDAETWARAFLASIDAPACQNNVVVLVAWQAQESTSAAWNPLATTHDMPSATVFNPIGVRNFVSLEQGLEATRDTLQLGSDTYGYQQILLALRACADPATTALAVNASAWCRGCSGGAYLTGLLPTVQQTYATFAGRTVASG